MGNYEKVNEVYTEYMSEPYPARAAMEISRLPIDIEVEIEVIAKKNNKHVFQCPGVPPAGGHLRLTRFPETADESTLGSWDERKGVFE